MSSENLGRARRGGVGRRCKYRRGSDTFTVRLALIRTLGQTCGDAHGETFGEAFGRDRIRGWRNLSLPLKVPLSAPLPL